LKVISVPIENIYVPVKRRSTLNPKTVQVLAESIMENGQQRPIHIRKDGARYVLVEGFHRLEACKALGEDAILAILVGARMY